MISSLAMVVLGLLFSAFFSGVETGGYTINRVRLKKRENAREPAAVNLSRLLGDAPLFIFTVLIGNNVAVFLLSAEVTDLYLSGGLEAGGLLLGVIPWNAETAATLTLMFPLFLLAEVGPKNLFRKRADSLMYRFAWLTRLIVWLLYPFTWPLARGFRLLTRGAVGDPGRDLHRLSPDALREYFSASEKGGVISSHQGRMMDNATSMHEVPVRMLMTPFKKVAVLPDSATVADFKRLAGRRETNEVVLVHRHAAVGVVPLFALVNRRLADDEPLKPYADAPLTLRDNRNLKSAFYRLRRNPRHRAVVVDSRGHPVGFLRLEDVARYIVKK